MNDYIKSLLDRYRTAGILIDTNILLLYYIGSFNIDLIPKFKNTQQFVVEDYYTLLRIFKHFEQIVTTPNIMTEVSNLSAQLGEPLKQDYFKTFADRISLLDEHYLSSKDIARMDEFTRFGLTDAAILKLVQAKYLVLTDDFRLSQYLQTKSVDVLNFNHIRTFYWVW